MESSSSLPRPLRSDFAFWLRRCEGFRVDAPQGRVGIVEELRFASRPDRPDVLVVRAGRLSARLLVVPVEEVVDIVPRQERVLLRHDPRPTGLLARLGQLGAARRRADEAPTDDPER